MKVVIIEDEPNLAKDIAKTINEADSNIQITAILHSVSNAITWFRNNNYPDLIFSDIQLGDGLCFEIFKKFDRVVPVIFCTAYDKYALNAFETNGIEYILKPITKNTIANALEKYRSLKENFLKDAIQYEKILELFEIKKTKTKRAVLVYYKDRILPVNFENIALFYSENKITYLITFDEKKYPISETLEELEYHVPDEFCRVNRKCIINRKIIKEANQYFNRRLLVHLNFNFNEEILISKEKVPDFLKWLTNK
jgi:two-component system, LytTR family, response regulator LytT